MLHKWRGHDPLSRLSLGTQKCSSKVPAACSPSDGQMRSLRPPMVGWLFSMPPVMQGVSKTPAPSTVDYNASPHHERPFDRRPSAEISATRRVTLGAVTHDEQCLHKLEPGGRTSASAGDWLARGSCERASAVTSPAAPAGQANVCSPKTEPYRAMPAGIPRQLWVVMRVGDGPACMTASLENSWLKQDWTLDSSVATLLPVWP